MAFFKCSSSAVSLSFSCSSLRLLWCPTVLFANLDTMVAYWDVFNFPGAIVFTIRFACVGTQSIGALVLFPGLMLQAESKKKFLEPDA